MVYLRAFPFLALAVAAYNILMVFRTGNLARIVAQIPLPSGDVWNLTSADVLLVFGLAMLFVEIVSAGSRTISVINHAFSLLLFILCGIEFLLVPGCGTGTFLLIMLMTFVDVVAGYTISIRMARRDYAIEKE